MLKVLDNMEYELPDFASEEYTEAILELEKPDRYVRPAKLVASGEPIMVYDYDALNMAERINFVQAWVNADIDPTCGGEYALTDMFTSQEEVNKTIRHTILVMTDDVYWNDETLEFIVTAIAPEFNA